MSVSSFCEGWSIKSDERRSFFSGSRDNEDFLAAHVYINLYRMWVCFVIYKYFCFLRLYVYLNISFDNSLRTPSPSRFKKKNRRESIYLTGRAVDHRRQQRSGGKIRQHTQSIYRLWRGFPLAPEALKHEPLALFVPMVNELSRSWQPANSLSLSPFQSIYMYLYTLLSLISFFFFRIILH